MNTDNFIKITLGSQNFYANKIEVQGGTKFFETASDIGENLITNFYPKMCCVKLCGNVMAGSAAEEFLYFLDQSCREKTSFTFTVGSVKFLSAKILEYSLNDLESGDFTQVTIILTTQKEIRRV